MLGAFNLRATATGDPLVAMLVTSAMFGYGAGIVARLGARLQTSVVVSPCLGRCADRYR